MYIIQGSPASRPVHFACVGSTSRLDCIYSVSSVENKQLLYSGIGPHRLNTHVRSGSVQCVWSDPAESISFRTTCVTRETHRIGKESQPWTIPECHFSLDDGYTQCTGFPNWVPSNGNAEEFPIPGISLVTGRHSSWPGHGSAWRTTEIV